MEVIHFTSLFSAKSRFVYTNNGDPLHIYRHNLEKFELWNIKDQSLICELHIHSIGKDIQFKYAHYLFDNDTLLFILATQTTDGLETFLYMMDPLHPSEFNRLSFNRKIKGDVSNIHISQKLQVKLAAAYKESSLKDPSPYCKSSHKKEYQIMTIGTMDSALYVFRFIASDILTQKEPLACTLARTDARNALTQEILVQANSMYVICGGSNGTMDFFLIKDDPDFSVPLILEYQRPDFLDLPSKLPIVSIQCLKHLDSDHVLLAIGQELFNPIRISRTIEPSMSLLKININDLTCKDIMTTKFSTGTHISPLRSDHDKYTLWTCYPDSKELRVTQSVLSKEKVVSIQNSFLSPPPRDMQQLYIKDEKNCWMVDEDGFIKSTATKSVSTKRQREK